MSVSVRPLHAHCYFDRPTKGTSLHALEIPSIGGNTLFASTARAYDTIAAELRQRLEELEILFLFDYRNFADRDKAGYVQPLATTLRARAPQAVQTA